MSEIQVITNKKGTTFRRKKRPKNYATQIYVRMPENSKEILEIIAKRDGKTVATICRELIDKYIRENV